MGKRGPKPKSDSLTTPISFSVSCGQRRALEEIARRESTTLSALVREAVESTLLVEFNVDRRGHP